MSDAFKKHLNLTCVFSVFALVLIIAINMRYTIDMLKMTQENSFLSETGLIMWCITASICLFAASILYQRQQAFHFMLYSGLLTSYLLIDDFWQFHELHIPKYIHHGEKLLYLTLAVAVLIYLIKYRRTILQTNYIVLLVALSFLSVSVAGDGILAPLEIIYAILTVVVLCSVGLIVFNLPMFKQCYVLFLSVVGLCVAYVALSPHVEKPEYILEDGAKWIGIAHWCSYYVYTAYQDIVNK